MEASVKISGLPIRARLCRLTSWRVQGVPDQPLTISRSEVGETRRCFDVWPIRDRFLALKTWEQAYEFFCDCGPFRREEEELQNKRPSRRESTTIDLATVVASQKLFRGFMEDEEWCSNAQVIFNKPVTAEQISRVFRGALLAGYVSPSFTLEMGHAPIKIKKEHVPVPSPFLNYEAEDVYRAVYASIYIDKMRGLRGGVCRREGCTNTFLTSDPRKRFCNAGRGSCSAAVRMQRTRQAERIARASGGNG